jgi:hypothetical protein
LWTNNGLVEFNQSRQSELLITTSHGVSYLLQYMPHSLLIHPKLPGQLRRGATTLVLSHLVDYPKPVAKRDFGSMEDGARGHRGLMMAVIALKEAPGWKEDGVVMAAIRAYETLGPS